MPLSATNYKFSTVDKEDESKDKEPFKTSFHKPRNKDYISSHGQNHNNSLISAGHSHGGFNQAYKHMPANSFESKIDPNSSRHEKQDPLLNSNIESTHLRKSKLSTRNKSVVTPSNQAKSQYNLTKSILQHHEAYQEIDPEDLDAQRKFFQERNRGGKCHFCYNFK